MTHVEGQAAEDLAPAAPALTQTAPPPVAAVTAGPQLPLGLTPDDARDAARILVRSLGPVLAALTALAAVVGIFGLPDEFGGSLADWLRTAVLLLALGMGGALDLDADMAAAGIVAATIGLDMRAVPLTVTVATVLLVVRAARGIEALRPSAGARQLWVRSAATGIAAGAATAVAGLLASTSEAYGLDLAGQFGVTGGVELGPAPLSSAVGAAALITLASGFGRTSGAPHLRPARVAALAGGQAADTRAVASVLRIFVVGLLAFAAAVAVLAFLHRLLLTDDLEGVRLASVGGALLLATNAAVVLALGSLGVPLGFSATATGQLELPIVDLSDLSGTTSGSLGLSDHGAAWLLLLVPTLAALATAVRHSLRGHVAPTNPRDLRIAAVVGAVVTFLAALAVSAWASARVSGSAAMFDGAGAAASGEATGGPSLLWAPLLGAAWAAGAVWAVRFGPTLALSVPPGVAKTLAGRGIAPEWSAALDGTGPAPAGQPSAALRLGARVATALAVLAAIGAAVVAAVNAFLLTPAAAADDYFAAVADRDLARAAAQLAEPPIFDRQPLLAAEVLGSDAFTPISGVSIGATDESDEHARVEVTYAVGNERRKDSVDLRQGEERYGLFRTWVVDESLPMVEVWSESGLQMEMAGDSLEEGSWLALPGRYAFGAADHPVLTAADSAFYVSTDEAQSPVLRPTVKPGAKQAAEAAVEERLAECASSTELPLDDCPYLSGYVVHDDAYDVEIEVTSAPEWSLTFDESISGFRIDSRQGGRVSYSYKYVSRSYFSDRTEERTYDSRASFWVDGEVTTSGKGFKVVFD